MSAPDPAASDDRPASNPIRDLDEIRQTLRAGGLQIDEVDRHELFGLYCRPTERYVVSLLFTYGDEDDQVQTSADAARAALDFIAEGCKIAVYDRHSTETHVFDPGQLQP